MKIQTQNSSKGYLHVTPETDADHRLERLLLGVRRRKGQAWWTVEDNLINRSLLGLPAEVEEECRRLTPEQARGLLDYQVKDVERMLCVRHVLNDNPMGLGKTIEAIVAMKVLGVKNALIVVPKSVMLQWQDQIAVWWPEMAERVKVLPTKVAEDGISILNYERLLNEATLLKLRGFRWDVLICDEAHRIKNAKSQRTKAVKSIPANRRWALTGTPILNKPDDLWSLLHYLDVRYSGISYWSFVDKFCNVIEGHWGRKIAGLTEDPVAEGLLQSMLEKISIRNSDIAPALGKLQGTVRVQMGPAQRKLYNAARDLVLDELPDNMLIPNGAVHVLRLSQLTSWPGLFEPGLSGAKFEWIKDLLEDNPNEKIVVFTRFAKSAVALVNYLGCAVPYIGDLSPEERALNVRLFLETPQTRALVGTIGALGQGVDGLQHASKTAVFLDRDWSPELMNQAEDRLNRMGQTRTVVVHYLECAGTFDQYVGRVNLSKAEDIRRALSDGNV